MSTDEPRSTAMNRDALVQILAAHLPNLLAVYAFGSRVAGTARVDSDPDLAALLRDAAHTKTNDVQD